MEGNCDIKPKPNTFKEFVKTRQFWKTLIVVVIGGVSGFLYYHFVGCSSGQCAITSNPYMSVLFGGLLGLFIINRPCSSGKC